MYMYMYISLVNSSCKKAAGQPGTHIAITVITITLSRCCFYCCIIVCTHIYVYTSLSLYIYTYIYIYTYSLIYLYIHLSLYIYIYIYTRPD